MKNIQTAPLAIPGADNVLQEKQPARNFRALIADDDAFFRGWLKDELTRSFPNLTSVYEAPSVKVAITKALTHKPDIVYLDIDFKDESLQGIRAAERIWRELPEVPIVIVSGYKSEIYVQDLHRVLPPNATYGWVMKGNAAQDVVRATERVLSGDCWLDTDVFRIFNRLGNRNSALTETEYTALLFIALGFSDRATAEICCIGEQAVQARLRSLYSKLGIPPKGTVNASVVNPRCRAVWLALQRGLITEPELKIRQSEIVRKSKLMGLDIDV